MHEEGVGKAAHQKGPHAPYLNATVLDCSKVKVHVQCETTSTADPSFPSTSEPQAVFAQPTIPYGCGTFVCVKSIGCKRSGRLIKKADASLV